MVKNLFLFALCMGLSWLVYLVNWFTGYVKSGASTERKTIEFLLVSLQNDFWSTISVPTIFGVLLFVVYWLKFQNNGGD